MKTWLLVLITALVTGGLVGGGTYYYLNNKNDRAKEKLQTQIYNLQNPSKDSVDNNVVDQTANWKEYTFIPLNLSFKYPEEWGNVNLDTKPTNDDPTYNYSFSNKKDVVIGYSTGKVTVGRGGGVKTEQYFWKKDTDLASSIKKDDKTMGGFIYEKASNPCDSLGCYEADSIVGVYLKIDSMYSNIVINMPDSAENRAVVENIIKSIAPDEHYIVGWKQYTNSTYKYSVYLPKDYVTTNGSTEANKSFSLTADDKWLFGINVSKNVGNKTLDAVVKEITDGKIRTSEKGAKATITDINVDRENAKRYSISGYGDVGNAGVVVLLNGNIYHLTGFDQTTAGEAVLANVILSFHFTK